MKQSIYKRILPIMMVLLLLLAAGCGKSPVKEAAEEVAAQEPVVIGTVPQTDAASVDHSSLYAVDGTTEASDNESYASDTANVNAILVERMGILTMTSADINKSGDATGDYTTGNNAAVAVISKGQLTLNQSNITTNGLGAAGLAVSGEGTQLATTDTSVYNSGTSSPAILVREDASAVITGGMLSTEGADSPSILLFGGRLTLNGVALSSKSGDMLRIDAGTNFLTLDNSTVSSMSTFAEEASLELRLSNGASFTGALGGTLPARASVYLDASSKLILTAETYLSALVNADLTHANIESNGFNLYYDSEAAENAYLESQSFMLPGGGFLAQII
ncbi:MAG: hypothetical protein R2912_04385 [Eubacteriales bacterium]